MLRGMGQLSSHHREPQYCGMTRTTVRMLQLLGHAPTAGFYHRVP